MSLRENNIDRMKNEPIEVLIVGGGINGAVSAASLSGKGVKTALIDRGDWAGMTSMHSSNLAWGGIKYMESYDFKLVRELCKCRNQLIHHYPSTVREIRFLTTIAKGFRHHPLFMWAGTWLYWFMGNCFTKIPRLPSLGTVNREEPIIDTTDAVGCFEYSDAYLHDNDARFVFNFVRQAMNSGCAAANYVESIGAVHENGVWRVQMRDVMSGHEFEMTAKSIVNACGPLADQFNERTGVETDHSHALSKGIHLIVDRLTPNQRVLAFFADDGRLFFVIPMGNRTCVGTTDTRTDDPHVPITDADVDFVLTNINERLRLDQPLTRDDIIGTRCGVRPLAVKPDTGADRDFLQLSRKHEIDADADKRYVSIFGGKLTDCINVGNEVAELVRGFGIEIAYPDYRWYGEPSNAVRDEFYHQARLMKLDDLTDPGASELLSTRLWRRYGGQALGLLENIREDPSQADILIDGTEYVRCEIRQAARREMITRLEDFLRRRSKISLVTRVETIRQSDGLMQACRLLFGDDAEARFNEYFEDHLPDAVTTGGDDETLPHDNARKAETTADNAAASEALNW